MALSKKNHRSYISVPSQIINSISQSSLDSLLLSPKKKHPSFSKLRLFFHTSRFFLFFIFVVGFLLVLNMCLNLDLFSRNPCSISQDKTIVSSGILSSNLKLDAEDDQEDEEFWKQPDGMGFRPCLEFSEKYKKEGLENLKDRTKYLMVVVAGGMNQQRNQIVDAVGIARILGASLVVPILQANVIWGDESEFADIFDLDHFKNVLAKNCFISSLYTFDDNASGGEENSPSRLAPVDSLSLS